MKRLVQTTLLFLFCATVVAQNQRDVFEVQVDGLGCPFCAYGLEKKFKEFKGIKKISIDIETGDFRFEYPSEQALSAEKVVAQVEKAGYTPNRWVITRADGQVESSEDSVLAVTGEQFQKASLVVRGVCGMCKARIEKAALSVEGIGQAEWSIEENKLVFAYDPSLTSKGALSKAILAVGHDVEGTKATDTAYEALPPCCLYRTKDKH